MKETSGAKTGVPAGLIILIASMWILKVTTRKSVWLDSLYRSDSLKKSNKGSRPSGASKSSMDKKDSIPDLMAS